MSAQIDTTTAGSFPRPDPLASMLNAAAHRQQVDRAKFAAAADEATAAVVGMQAAAGVTLISDGEMRQPSFMDARCRLAGFGGPPVPWILTDLGAAGLTLDGAQFFMETAATILPSCNGPIRYLPEAAEERIAAFQRALAEHGLGVGSGFLPVPSPGVLARNGNGYYGSDQEFLEAIATALAEEYAAIVHAGLTVQLDAPELAHGWHTDHAGMPVEDYRAIVAEHIRAINIAVAGLPRHMVRLHMCWGNYRGPHHLDLPLEKIIDLLYQANVGTLVLTMANGQHRHERDIFARYPLPGDMKVAAGVIDTLTSTAEHPQTVADGIVRVARHVGPDRVIAGTDCGFGTFACWDVQPPEIVALKLQALTGGAAIASKALYS
jgi:5-methyltetrahydropteroyltriglutamate--homocysteine methyltransferase